MFARRPTPGNEEFGLEDELFPLLNFASNAPVTVVKTKQPLLSHEARTEVLAKTSAANTVKPK